MRGIYLPSKKVFGWNGTEPTPDKWPVMDLKAACQQRWTTDGYWLAYAPKNLVEFPRINKTALQKHPALEELLQLDHLILDCDSPLPGHAFDPTFRDKCLEACEALPWYPGWWESRTGLRLVWPLPRPLRPSQYEPLAKSW